MTNGDKKQKEKALVEPVLEEKIHNIVDEAQLPKVKSLDTAENIASTTTAEQDLQTKDKRSINLFEETTQRNIAYWVIGFALVANFMTVLVGSYCLLMDITPSPLVMVLGSGALMQLNTLAGIIVGFYFGKLKESQSRTITVQTMESIKS